jgi:hypothetical protein
VGTYADDGCHACIPACWVDSRPSRISNSRRLSYQEQTSRRLYPVAVDGKAQKFNDIPVQYRANVNVSAPPFNRQLGQAPVMTAQEKADIIEFLKTLNDGNRPVK